MSHQGVLPELATTTFFGSRRLFTEHGNRSHLRKLDPRSTLLKRPRSTRQFHTQRQRRVAKLATLRRATGVPDTHGFCVSGLAREAGGVGMRRSSPEARTGSTRIQ